jgi:hypothetical protein
MTIGKQTPHLEEPAQNPLDLYAGDAKRGDTKGEG